VFNEDTPYELIKKIKPDIITKGGDYEIEYVVGSDLAEVVIIPYVDGYSTTKIAEKMK
jgi:D-beta-D-heptose 7-phosphate kinase/D-beta-D-heptose 1-phosphate adenosyltransferase